MKKTKKKNIFQKIGILIDKKIIMPITKSIMKIIKKLDTKEKTFEGWLSKSNTLLFVSLFIAIIIFVAIDQKIIVFTDQTAEVLKEQKVEATYNEEAYVVEGLPKTVDITLMGSRSDLFIAKQSTASKVAVDLTGLKTGTHKVNIEYSQPINTIESSVNPSVVTVNIYPKVSETKTLTTDILNQDKLDSKLVINSITPSLEQVVVKGTDDKTAENSLSKVATVKALIDIDNLTKQEVGETTVKDVPLKAYDKDGNTLNVEIVPSKISVNLDIESPSKTVPIKVIPKGNIGFGKAISNIDMSEQTVTVYGNKSALENLEYVPLKVDVSGLKENSEYKLDLSKPKGIRAMSVNNVTLKFTLGESTDKKIENINIDVKNLNDKYSVQGLSAEDTKVTINVKGVDGVLKNITSDDINAYINLKNYTPGEYEVPVKVEGTDSRVQYAANPKKVKIKVVEK